MKVGFDVSQTGTLKAGTGYFAYSLIDMLLKVDKENEYVLYPTFGEYYWDPNWRTAVGGLPGIKDHLGLSHTTAADARNFWRTPPLNLEEKLGKPDILHANNFYCPRGLSRTKLIFTLYDLGFLVEPTWTTEANRLICFSGVFNASILADGLLAISESSRTAFLEYFPHFPPDRVKTISLGSRFTDRSPVKQPDLPAFIQAGRYWLAVSTLEPRKNYRRLIEAYARLKSSQDEVYPLVLVGGSGWLMEDFEQEFASAGLADSVYLTGYIDDASLLWWYRNCFAFVYPSLYEGFGMPILEAMSQSAAVITSNTSSMPEVAGDAGILVDPYNVEEIAAAMVRLAKGEVNRDELRAKGPQRAKLFNWETTAKETLALYQEILALPYRNAAQNDTPAG